MVYKSYQEEYKKFFDLTLQTKRGEIHLPPQERFTFVRRGAMSKVQNVTLW